MGILVASTAPAVTLFAGPPEIVDSSTRYGFITGRLKPGSHQRNGNDDFIKEISFHPLSNV
jgi:hypothetical protein